MGTMSNSGSGTGRSLYFAASWTKINDNFHAIGRDLCLDRTGFVMTTTNNREELEMRLVQARKHAAEPHEALAQTRLNLVVSELEKQLGFPLSRLG